MAAVGRHVVMVDSQAYAFPEAGVDKKRLSCGGERLVVCAIGEADALCGDIQG